MIDGIANSIQVQTIWLNEIQKRYAILCVFYLCHYLTFFFFKYHEVFDDELKLIIKNF